MQNKDLVKIRNLIGPKFAKNEDTIWTIQRKLPWLDKYPYLSWDQMIFQQELKHNKSFKGLKAELKFSWAQTLN